MESRQNQPVGDGEGPTADEAAAAAAVEQAEEVELVGGLRQELAEERSRVQELLLQGHEEIAQGKARIQELEQYIARLRAGGASYTEPEMTRLRQEIEQTRSDLQNAQARERKALADLGTLNAQATARVASAERKLTEERTRKAQQERDAQTRVNQAHTELANAHRALSEEQGKHQQTQGALDDHLTQTQQQLAQQQRRHAAAEQNAVARVRAAQQREAEATENLQASTRELAAARAQMRQRANDAAPGPAPAGPGAGAANAGAATGNGARPGTGRHGDGDLETLVYAAGGSDTATGTGSASHASDAESANEVDGPDAQVNEAAERSAPINAAGAVGANEPGPSNPQPLPHVTVGANEPGPANPQPLPHVTETVTYAEPSAPVNAAEAAGASEPGPSNPQPHVTETVTYAGPDASSDDRMRKIRVLAEGRHLVEVVDAIERLHAAAAETAAAAGPAAPQTTQLAAPQTQPAPQTRPAAPQATQPAPQTQPEPQRLAAPQPIQPAPQTQPAPLPHVTVGPNEPGPSNPQPLPHVTESVTYAGPDASSDDRMSKIRVTADGPHLVESNELLQPSRPTAAAGAAAPQPATQPPAQSAAFHPGFAHSDTATGTDPGGGTSTDAENAVQASADSAPAIGVESDLYSDIESALSSEVSSFGSINDSLEHARGLLDPRPAAGNVPGAVAGLEFEAGNIFNFDEQVPDDVDPDATENAEGEEAAEGDEETHDAEEEVSENEDLPDAETREAPIEGQSEPVAHENLQAETGGFVSGRERPAAGSLNETEMARKAFGMRQLTPRYAIKTPEERKQKATDRLEAQRREARLNDLNTRRVLRPQPHKDYTPDDGRRTARQAFIEWVLRAFPAEDQRPSTFDGPF